MVKGQGGAAASQTEGCSSSADVKHTGNALNKSSNGTGYRLDKQTSTKNHCAFLCSTFTRRRRGKQKERQLPQLWQHFPEEERPEPWRFEEVGVTLLFMS